MGTDAGVVDQQRDAGVLAQSAFYQGALGGVAEVGSKGIDALSGLRRQAQGQRAEPCSIPRNKDEVVAAAGQALGVEGANAGGGAGDQRGSEGGGGSGHCRLQGGFW